MSKDLEKHFGITPVEKSKTDIINPQVEEDFLAARKNLLDVIDAGTEAVKQLQELAETSEHFKYYDSLNAHLRTLVEANKTLMSVRTEAIRVDKERAPSQKITNNLVITTADLARMLQNKDKDDKESSE